MCEEKVTFIPFYILPGMLFYSYILQISQKLHFQGPETMFPNRNLFSAIRDLDRQVVLNALSWASMILMLDHVVEFEGHDEIIEKEGIGLKGDGLVHSETTPTGHGEIATFEQVLEFG